METAIVLASMSEVVRKSGVKIPEAKQRRIDKILIFGGVEKSMYEFRAGVTEQAECYQAFCNYVRSLYFHVTSLFLPDQGIF